MGIGLPKFCPNCGVKLEFEDAKFCPECGFSLTKGETSIKVTVREEQASEAKPSGSVFDLGNKLEQVVEKILQAKGYETERRKKMQGRSGTLSEIDIIGKKTDKTIAVECKNFSEPIGIEKVRDFVFKLEDLGYGWKGVFVAYNGFTDGAAQLAQSKNIETWDHDEISEKWLALSVGREGASYRGQSLLLQYALPLKVTFDQVSQVNLLNKDKVMVSNVQLIYHPYYKIEYMFKAIFKDPTRETHKFEDRDILFIDALDGRILNPMPETGLGAVKRVFKVLASKSARAESERNKKLIQELKHNRSAGAYSLDVKADYTVTNLKPIVTPSEATESSINFIIEKNTTEVTYYPESEDDEYIESESVTFIPKRRGISIIRKDIVLMPKWSAEFDAFGIIYNKEILGCSGVPLEDTISFCPKHFKLGAIAVSKRTIAVCEACGLSLCEDHVKQCPICNKWLCEDHGVECSECKKRFCKEHIEMTCPICGSPLCDSCVTVCPICSTKYGKRHAVSCDQCGTTVCPNCVSTTGLIRKKRTCKKCMPMT
jgi:hypothetical protein